MVENNTNGGIGGNSEVRAERHQIRPDAAAFKRTPRQRPRRVQFFQRKGSEEKALRTGAFSFTDSKNSINCMRPC